jgi:hypothetical protein
MDIELKQARVLIWNILLFLNIISLYLARPQSKFPTRPTASKPYIAW